MSEVRPGLVKLLFGVLALVAVVGLSSMSPKTEAERWQAILAFTGILVTSFGMIIPWGRWLPLVSPGEKLGQVTQVLGWFAAGAVPFAAASGHVPWTGACVLVAASALATWKERIWAAWTWYAMAVAIIAAAGVNVVTRFLEARVSVADTLGLLLGAISGCLFWFWFVREVTAWRRRVRLPSATPGLDSTS